MFKFRYISVKNQEYKDDKNLIKEQIHVKTNISALLTSDYQLKVKKKKRELELYRPSSPVILLR